MKAPVVAISTALAGCAWALPQVFTTRAAAVSSRPLPGTQTVAAIPNSPATSSPISLSRDDSCDPSDDSCSGVVRVITVDKRTDNTKSKCVHKGKGKKGKGKGHKGKGHKGKGHKGKGHKGKGHKHKGHKGEEHKGEEHKGEEHKGEEHKGKGHEGKDGKGGHGKKSGWHAHKEATKEDELKRDKGKAGGNKGKRFESLFTTGNDKDKPQDATKQDSISVGLNRKAVVVQQELSPTQVLETQEDGDDVGSDAKRSLLAEDESKTEGDSGGVDKKDPGSEGPDESSDGSSDESSEEEKGDEGSEGEGGEGENECESESESESENEGGGKGKSKGKGWGKKWWPKHEASGHYHPPFRPAFFRLE